MKLVYINKKGLADALAALVHILFWTANERVAEVLEGAVGVGCNGGAATPPMLPAEAAAEGA
jgi:hypothetical protein